MTSARSIGKSFGHASIMVWSPASSGAPDCAPPRLRLALFPDKTAVCSAPWGYSARDMCGMKFTLNNSIWLILAGLTLLTVGGCMPATYITVPALHGRVLDANSRPISGAMVEITKEDDGHQVATIISGPDGRFSRPEDGHFFLDIPGADLAAQSYSVGAIFRGHRSTTAQVYSDLRVWFLWPRLPSKDLGDLRIQ